MCKVERNAGRVTYNPAIVPWHHFKCLAGSDFLFEPRGILNDHVSRNNVSNVIFRWFSGLRSRVQRPFPSGLVGS
jgi:hypothetical protein